jgi:hypothetical protein
MYNQPGRVYVCCSDVISSVPSTVWAFTNLFEIRVDMLMSSDVVHFSFFPRQGDPVSDLGSRNLPSYPHADRRSTTDEHRYGSTPVLGWYTT